MRYVITLLFLLTVASSGCSRFYTPGEQNSSEADSEVGQAQEPQRAPHDRPGSQQPAR